MIYEGTLILEHKKKVATDTLLLSFRVEKFFNLIDKTQNLVDTSPFSFEAGQFLSLQMQEKAWRAYSIASISSEKNIELLIRIVKDGIGSSVVQNLQKGESLNFKGPFGHFVLSENKQAHLVFCGTGTGIAPLRSMIITEAQKKNPRKMSLFYGGRDSEDIAYLDELEKWAPTTNFDIYLGLSRQKNPVSGKGTVITGRITEFFDTTNDQHYAVTQHDEFYICGNGNMVLDLQERLKDKNIEKSRIFFERFN